MKLRPGSEAHPGSSFLLFSFVAADQDRLLVREIGDRGRSGLRSLACRAVLELCLALQNSFMRSLDRLARAEWVVYLEIYRTGGGVSRRRVGLSGRCQGRRWVAAVLRVAVKSACWRSWNREDGAQRGRRYHRNVWGT